MGCFLVCFKERKRCRKHKKSLPLDKEKESCAYVHPISSGVEVVAEIEGDVHNPILNPRNTQDESCNYVHPIYSGVETIPEIAADVDNPFSKPSENQEQGAVLNVRKKVTFDLHVTTIEIVPVHEDPKDFTEDDETEITEKEEKNDKEEEESIEAAYPPNHRYQNCDSSDDEGLDEEDDASDEEEETDFDETNDIDINEDEDESYDSYFSLPMEGERKYSQDVTSPKTTIESITEREMTFLSKANVRDRSRYIHSVLNPVENISHWKEIKVRPTSLKNQTKENLDIKPKHFISAETIFSKSENHHKSICSNATPDDFGKQDIALDASLSSWLISSNHSRLEQQTSNSIVSNSTISQEDRPILGALTMEDIKQSSRNSSPRRSPSKSPEDVPIVGTVGGYWNSKSKEDSASSWSSNSENRGIPNTTNKYREDKKVNLYLTPFETRLERALSMESSETFSNVESTA